MGKWCSFVWIMDLTFELSSLSKIVSSHLTILKGDIISSIIGRTVKPVGIILLALEELKGVKLGPKTRELACGI
ncbi:hypothetical protein H5410_055297 [Solanum commersonii]|uniref:Uncharacterized protein n=1 Tax=Solanum commersonii TaxID=4109 RepID=A0A9J5WH73_SOLCO|nr:hypothetical protein H5410_055297 [Solanum commersonii]